MRSQHTTQALHTQPPLRKTLRSEPQPHKLVPPCPVSSYLAEGATQTGASGVVRCGGLRRGHTTVAWRGSAGPRPSQDGRLALQCVAGRSGRACRHAGEPTGGAEEPLAGRANSASTLEFPPSSSLPSIAAAAARSLRC